MNSNNIKKLCCYCEREITNDEDTLMVKSLSVIPKVSKYLCQDCCLDASIFIGNIINGESNKNKDSKYIKFSSVLHNNLKQKEVEKSFVTNSIVVDNDPSKPKILLEKTKKQVFDEVTKKVKYQDIAIKRIIRTVYSNLCIEDPTFKDNILLIGDTGVGKTFSVTSILKAWNIPYVIADSNDFSETGYVGKDVDSVIEKLYNVCGKNSELASRGVIVLDEIDKLRANNSIGRDVSGQSVQEELLTLLTGKNVEVGTNDYVDTSFITFILMGAFDSINKDEKLSEIREKRIEKSKLNAIGFAKPTNDIDKKPIITSYTSEDFSNYGIISQLSSRCSTIIELNKFCEDMCKTILFESNSSKLNHIIQKFNNFNISLNISNDVLNCMCKYIVELEKGGRGIASFLTELFDPALQKIEDDLDNDIAEYETCVITEETIIDHNSFKLIKKKMSAIIRA